MNTSEANYVLNGLDSYGKEELDNFWKNYDPKKDAPKILSICLSCSVRCNLKCIYCYAGPKKPAKNELTLEEQKSIIGQAKELGAKTAVVCGDGEPSMDKNIVPIAQYCHELGIICIVVTNAIIFGDDKFSRKVHGVSGWELANLLYDAGVSLMVKMDAMYPGKYDTIVGIKGAYQKFNRAINNITNIGFGNSERVGEVDITRLSFSAVVMRNTIGDLRKMKEFANEKGGQFICKLPSLVGDALSHLNFMFPASDYESIREIIMEYTSKRETLMADTPRCIAWHYGPVIDTAGEIRECYTSECRKGRIGNIREDALGELIKKRNKLYDISVKDFCPVKTRINKEFAEAGKKELWQVLPENRQESMKHF